MQEVIGVTNISEVEFPEWLPTEIPLKALAIEGERPRFSWVNFAVVKFLSLGRSDLGGTVMDEMAGGGTTVASEPNVHEGQDISSYRDLAKGESVLTFSNLCWV